MRRAAIVAPVRTPVGAFGGALRGVPVEELGAVAARAVVERTGLDPARIVVLGDAAYKEAERRGLIKEKAPKRGPVSSGRKPE